MTTRSRSLVQRQRLPWLRRTSVPRPDGTVEPVDRAHRGRTYYEGGEGVLLNPFTLVYDEIWTMLEQSVCFTSMVPANNRIRYTTALRRPDKSRRIDSDFPECRIAAWTIESGMYETSTNTRVVRNYLIQLRTGKGRIDVWLNPMEWCIIESMMKWKDNLTSLRYRGEQFVKRADFVNPADSLYSDEDTAGYLGWTTVFEIEVEMYFSSLKMLEG